MLLEYFAIAFFKNNHDNNKIESNNRLDPSIPFFFVCSVGVKRCISIIKATTITTAITYLLIRFDECKKKELHHRYYK